MKPIEAIKKGNENKVHTNLIHDVKVQKPPTRKFNVSYLARINKSMGVLIKFTSQITELKCLNRCSEI